MTILQSFFLGILQGLTEFLPVSSSGHLVVAEHFLGLTLPQSELQHFDIVLHAGTLLALVFCYWSVWKKLLLSLIKRDREAHMLILLLIIGTIPAGIVGLLFEDVIAEQLRGMKIAGVGFLFTALVLLLGEYAGRKEGGSERPTILSSILIGIAQAIALVPSVSRSGMTIAVARSLGLSRMSAVDFSFLLAMPAIAGASVLTLKSFLDGDVILPRADVIGVGFFASLVSSALAIVLLRRWVRKRSVAWFALYLFPLGVVLLLS